MFKAATGFKQGKPSLTFKVTSGKHAPKVSRLTIALPSGLSFTRHRVHGKRKLTGVSVRGAVVKSLSLSHGRLVITLRTASAGVTVMLGPASLKESATLRAKAEHNAIRRLKLTVIVRNAKHRNKTLWLSVKLSRRS
ncbi:MAG: hypothetical protein ACR2NR_23935 [Solirubrobacteraceae bacterium]